MRPHVPLRPRPLNPPSDLQVPPWPGNMAKFLNKDPVTYEREREGFIKDLHHFHETRGTAFKKYPKISGKEVDLYLLYVLVTAHGGWIKVNSKNEWSTLCEQFHLPNGCVNSGVGLKQIYLRYLDRYEKVHFLGEDGQQADDDDEDSRHRKWSARSLHSVPLTYNHHQHNVTESLRDYNGLSADLYKPSNYDKLALSLLSPLPNEQDFAINVCTLLSNEGKHTLRLDKYPRLVNILLAHAGVFDCLGTRQLFIEVYSKVRNYSINSFWSDVLDSQDVIDLTDERIFLKKPSPTLNTFSRRRNLKKEKANKTQENQEESSTPAEPVTQEISECVRLISQSEETLRDQNQNSIKFEEEDHELFCVGRTLGTQDPYGQRVLQIASILRNLSFTAENAAVLGRNRCFLRFVLLCIRSRWSNLHQLGFDTFGNVANEIILNEAGPRICDVAITCVTSGIDSQDRFIVIACLEILNKISQQDCNEDTLTSELNDHVYELICRFLALSDIALLVYTLECLYALTSLGEKPCTSVARVRGAIDTLVALVTVEAQSYGPKACILMRVVETVSTIPTSAAPASGSSTTPASTSSTPATTSVVSVSTPTPITATLNPSPSASPVPVPVPVAVAVTAPAPTPALLSTPLSPAPSRPSTPAASVVTAPAAVVVAPAPSTPVTPVKTMTHKAIETASPVQPQNTHQQIIQENEQFALLWLRTTFELAPGVRIEQEELYKKYLGFCTKSGRRGVIAPLHFPRCVRLVFGASVGPNAMKGDSSGVQCYDGIRVRSLPVPVSSSCQMVVGTNTTQTSMPIATLSTPMTIGSNITPAKVLPVQQRSITAINPVPDSTALDNSGIQKSPAPASPILKAQLSAPPKPPTPNQAQNPVTKIDSKSQVSVSHPHLSQALLATGSQTQQLQQPQQQQQQQSGQVQVQCQQQQQQQLQLQQSQSQQQQQQIIQIIQSPSQQIQVMVREDARASTTSSSIIKSLLATKVTVSGDCMPSAATTCVSVPSACVTNTTSIASGISVNQLITNNQVAQRQQQQRLLQQQLNVQSVTPATTPTSVGCQVNKPFVNSKQKTAIVTTPAKKIQRLNGAKVIMTNNFDKTEVSDNENGQTKLVMQVTSDNHLSLGGKICRPPTITSTSVSSSTVNKNQRSICTSIAEDSDSTNNSLASSSGIGGSRDCSGVGPEEENSLTSFEGILLNGVPTNLDIDAQDDGSSKDSSSISCKEKPLQTMMLADLLEKKVDKEPVLNGVLGKNSINEKGMDLVENHIKKVLKESPTDIKIKVELEDNMMQTDVSDDALIEAPRNMKRSANEINEVESKKPKYSNGTTSPDPAVDSTTVESTLSSIKSEDLDDDKDGEKATVSSTAANLYAALAADIIEDETDLEDPMPIIPKEESLPMIKVEAPQQTVINQFEHQQAHQQLIMAHPRQIMVQQAIQQIQSNSPMIIPTVKGRQAQSQPQVLLQQGAGGQLQYVVSGGVPGQNYVLAQPQTALVQGQAQTVLVAQTTQQQGTGAKTIIILQPQTQHTQPTAQKMVAVTPQGQQSPALGNIPPPLVPTSAAIPQSIIVNSSVAQSNQNTVTVTIPALAQQCPVTTSIPSRVVTPTPASTPPPTRPTTPHQAAATHAITMKQPIKIVKTVSSSTSTEPESKPSTSQQTEPSPKTITIKIDPNAFLCEWRGCLRQFKTSHDVYLHVCEAHCPNGGEEILCLWSSCDNLKRRRFSLMTHLYDRHCNGDVMSVRRKQLTLSGKTEVLTTSAPVTTAAPISTSQHPGYAPNAAFHAIKRHALEFVNPKELMQRPTKPAAAITSTSSPRPGQNPPPEQDDNEGPVTKSIRLTAALILRNLVIYSAHGRRHLRAYEPHLAGVALSNVESSRTIAQVLYDMNDQSNSSHR
ncbi:AT-rich interactive domain-containing protein 2-like isoform X3 [Leptopilina heterotoma]|uniref:AT-rich interactive domain-containing protein 2-like isoform X3 n=1 Tax=Leptopilina heterotoma TaxID=63436 RepID=UPI001CA841C1|nr:AT-rich interactive domain-containing protein 2-like isoform X3 [Leptopilina heterotoma]